jgi:hypothetical protein
MSEVKEAPLKDRKSIKLFHDSATFEIYKAKEIQIENLVNKYDEIILSTIGDIKVNYKDLLANPVEWICNKYWTTWGSKNYPDTISKEEVFETATRLSVSRIKAIETKIEAVTKELGKYAPVFFDDGLSSRVSPNYFDRYLDPEKADEYNALKSFLDSAKELEKYGSNMPIHLLRYANNVQFDNDGAVAINLTHFQC